MNTYSIREAYIEMIKVPGRVFEKILKPESRSFYKYNDKLNAIVYTIDPELKGWIPSSSISSESYFVDYGESSNQSSEECDYSKGRLNNYRDFCKENFSTYPKGWEDYFGRDDKLLLKEIDRRIEAAFEKRKPTAPVTLPGNVVNALDIVRSAVTPDQFNKLHEVIWQLYRNLHNRKINVDKSN